MSRSEAVIAVVGSRLMVVPVRKLTQDFFRRGGRGDRRLSRDTAGAADGGLGSVDRE